MILSPSKRINYIKSISMKRYIDHLDLLKDIISFVEECPDDKVACHTVSAYKNLFPLAEQTVLSMHDMDLLHSAFEEIYESLRYEDATWYDKNFSLLKKSHFPLTVEGIWQK